MVKAVAAAPPVCNNWRRERPRGWATVLVAWVSLDAESLVLMSRPPEWASSVIARGAGPSGDRHCQGQAEAGQYGDGAGFALARPDRRGMAATSDQPATIASVPQLAN